MDHNDTPQPPLAQTESDATPVIPRKRVIGAFAFAAFVFLVLTIFYFQIIPKTWILFAVPQFVLLLLLITPILLWQTLAERSLSRKISVCSSAIIWVLGIVVAFIFKPPSPFINMSDGLLLLGFVPLLYMWRFSIPWIVFGLFNGGIGIFLLLLSLLNDSYFPASLWGPKHHLAEYHPYMTWILFAFGCCLFGSVRLAKNLYLMGARRRPAQSLKDSATTDQT
jgi:hypothetical protein